MEGNLKAFGSWLKRLLEDHQKTGADLAREIQVRDSTISRIINGKAQPSPKTVELMAIALNVKYDEMLVRAGYPGMHKIDTADNLTPEQRELLSNSRIFGLARKLNELPEQQKQMVESYINFIEAQTKDDRTKKNGGN